MVFIISKSVGYLNQPCIEFSFSSTVEQNSLLVDLWFSEVVVDMYCCQTFFFPFLGWTVEGWRAYCLPIKGSHASEKWFRGFGEVFHTHNF